MTSWTDYPVLDIPSPVVALAASANSLWAGGAGGLARFQEGAGWRLFNTNLPLSSVTALCFTGGWLIAAGAEGMVRSGTTGRSWQSAEIQAPSYPINSITASPQYNQNSELLAGTLGGGVLRSENAGRTWKPSNFGLQNFEVFALAWGVNDLVLAATSDGLYRSPNGGRAWKTVNGTEGVSYTSVVFDHHQSAFAAREEGVLETSTNQGSTWKPLKTKGLATGESYTQLFAIDTGLFASVSSYAAGEEDGTYHSPDSGLTWSRISADPALVFTHVDHRTLIGTSHGVAAIQGTSVEMLPSPCLQDVRLLAVNHSLVMAAGLQSGVWRLSGDHWTVCSTAPQPITTLDLTSDGAILASGPQGMFRSIDSGQTWECVLPETSGFMSRITSLLNGSAWAASADSTRLIRSRDFGKTWTALEAPFGVFQLAALQAGGGLVFAATFDPAHSSAQIWVSDNEGDTWKRGATVKTNWPVLATCSQPPLITMGNSAYILERSGNWEQRQVSPIRSGLRRMTSSGTALAALATSGLFISMDVGQSWQPLPDCPPVETILDISLVGNTLYFWLTEGRLRSTSLV